MRDGQYWFLTKSYISMFYVSPFFERVYTQPYATSHAKYPIERGGIRNTIFLNRSYNFSAVRFIILKG